MNTDLVVLTFSDPTGADDMLKTVQELQVEDFIEVVDAVVVTKDAKNKVEVRQPLEVGPGKGAAFGAVTGAVVGLLGGPAGAVVGLVAGGVTGGAAGAAFEAGLPTQEIKSVARQELAPGESALLLYLEEVWLDQIEWTARDLAKSIEHQVIAEERKTAREKSAELRKEKIDAAYKAWQAKIDHLRASVASTRQKAASSLQADREAAQKQIDGAQAKLTADYKNMVQALRAWHQQTDADISELEAGAKQANAAAKADIEKRVAAAREARQALRAHTKDTLSVRLNGLKTDVEALKVKAVNAPAEVKAKHDQRVAKLQADWEADWKALDQFNTATDAAWDQMVKNMDAAIDTYEAAVRAAEDEADKKA